MAPFNRYIQATNDPTYLGYSHEISAPTPNLSFGKLFAGIGDTVDTGLKAATDLLDINIKKEARAGIKSLDAESGANVSPEDAASLGRLKNKLEGGSDALGSSPVRSSEGGATLLPDNTQNVPATPPVVKDGISRLDYLTELYHQGMLSPTYYLTQQQVVTQQLKQRFPGSEVQVDAAIHRETESANTIRGQVFADFQAAATAANAHNKEYTGLVRANLDVLGEQGTLKALSPEVMSDRNKQIEIEAYIAKIKNANYQVETRHKDINLKIAKSNLTAQDKEAALTLDLHEMVAKGASGALSPLTDLRTKIDKAATTGDFTTKDLDVWRGELANMRRILDDAFTSHINNPKFEGGQSYNSLIPDKSKIAAIRKTATEQLDFIDDALNNKDPKVGVALAGWHLRRLETEVGMSADKLIQRSADARALAGTQKALGGDGSLTVKILGDNRNLSNKVYPGTNTPMSAMSAIWTDVLDANTAKIITGGGHLGEATTPQAGTPPPAPVLAQTIKNVKTVITDPSSPPGMRANAVKYLTGDVEGKFFKELDRPSQLKAFNELTSPDVSKSINDLGNPEQYNTYKSWATNIYTATSNSRRGDIQTLLGNKQLGLAYDPKTNQLTWNTPNQGRGQGEVPYPELQTAIQMNIGLRNLDAVYKQDKTNASDVLGPMFKGMGIPIKEEGTGKSNYNLEPVKPAVKGDALQAIDKAIGKGGVFGGMKFTPMLDKSGNWVTDASTAEQIPQAQKAPDGNWYVPNPKGGWLKVIEGK